MWLVTFLLLLDSLHKGETRAAGGWAVEAAGPGCARLEAKVRCPMGTRCPSAGPTRVHGAGWARELGRFREKGRVRVSLGLLVSPPAPAV